MPKNLLQVDELKIEFKDIQETVVTLDNFVESQPDETLSVAPAVVTRLELLRQCPRCNKPLVPAKAISGDESVSFKECPECGVLVNTYNPTVYQARFLSRPERYKMTSGGFGSGKSRADIEDVIKHLLLITSACVVLLPAPIQP